MKIIQSIVLSVLAFIVSINVYALPGDENWLSMSELPGANNIIRAVIRSGTDMYVGGDFTAIGNIQANYIAKWDGSQWSTLGTGMNNKVYALALDSNGNLYAAGDFNSAGGTAANNHVAKWNGSSWSSLGSGNSNGTVMALAIDSNNNLYAGGVFGSMSSSSGFNFIAKWNGTAWSKLSTGMNSYVYSLAVDSSNILYAGGDFTSPGNHIAKWNGTSWIGLSPLGASGRVYALAIDSNDTVYAGGLIKTAEGVIVNNIAKWSGGVWSALGLGVKGQVFSLHVDSSDILYAGGTFQTLCPDLDCLLPGTVVNNTARWNGSAWSTLGTGFPTCNGNPCTPTIMALSFDANGSLYASGNVNLIGGVYYSLAKWSGTSWTNLNSGINSYIRSLAKDGSGNVYIGGSFTTVPGKTASRVAKWNGSTWSALALGVNSDVTALASDNGGNLYAGSSAFISKWNGTYWTSIGTVNFCTGTSCQTTVENLVCDSFGNLYAVGNFTSVGGVAANRIAKWNGSVWSALGTGIGSNYASDLAADSNGNIYVGGNFSGAGGVANTANIAKWNGSTWSSLGSGVNNHVSSLVVDNGGNLFAGGNFTLAGEATVNRVAKWNGTAWSALGAGLGGPATALASDGNNNIYAVGQIYGGAYNVMFWDGETWTALSSGMNSLPVALLLDGSGNLYLGGNFTIIAGKAASYLAKWIVPDSDGDGVNDSFDKFPFNPAESVDTDSDTIGNNADWDDDGDGVPDVVDAAPLDNGNASEITLPLDAVYKGRAVKQNALAP